MEVLHARTIVRPRWTAAASDSSSSFQPFKGPWRRRSPALTSPTHAMLRQRVHSTALPTSLSADVVPQSSSFVFNCTHMHTHKHPFGYFLVQPITARSPLASSSSMPGFSHNRRNSIFVDKWSVKSFITQPMTCLFLRVYNICNIGMQQYSDEATASSHPPSGPQSESNRLKLMRSSDERADFVKLVV